MSKIYGQKRLKMPEASPTVIIIASFALVIFVGALLLLLPVSRQYGQPAPGFLKCIFTAASATCVTGLVVFDTATYWSLFGQVVILCLIQIGGLGLITITLFVGSILKRRFGLKDLTLAQETVNYNSLPEVRRILYMVVLFSFAVETVGALLLVPALGKGFFTALFTSVSAYCNAGFDLMGGGFSSLKSVSGSPFALITVMCLIVIGGMGVLVWYDAYGSLRGRRKLMLNSSVIFRITALLIVSGALLFFLLEKDNPFTIGRMSAGDKVLNSFFQSVTTRTAGFSSVSMAAMNHSTKVLFMVLMFIGAAPGSTAGGIKITTFWVVVMTIWSYLRGRQSTVIGGKRVSYGVVYRAMTIMLLVLALVFLSAGTIFAVENDYYPDIQMTDVLFEVFSAAATVGLSADLTPLLHPVSLSILTLDMFLGRVGLVTFTLAITAKRARDNKNEVLPEGKIMVG